MNPFSSGGSGRAAHRRRDPSWLEQRARDPGSRFVPLWRGQNLLRLGDAPEAVLLTPQQVGQLAPDAQQRILLDEHGSGVVFAFDVAAEEAPPWPGEFVDLRGYGALLDPRDAALLAQARAMVHWHRRQRFCGDCGTPTQSADAGYLRVCTDPQCAAQHFPRTDPAIIVLVTRGDRCVLARQQSWPERMYSTIAGFVEPGESLEDAVLREVREEVGLHLLDLRYHSSQPWPFPASLMAGFTATAAADQLRVDHDELEDARWVTRDELVEAVRAQRIVLPSRASIAYALLRDWVGIAL